MLHHHLKIAWRNLLRSKGFSLLNVTGLAVGMAVTLLIGLWVWDEISFDKFHKKYDRLYQVMVNDQFDYYGDGGKVSTIAATPLALCDAFRESFPEIVRVAESDWGWEHGLVVGKQRFFKRGMQVHGDFLKMFSFQLLEGDVDNVLSDPASIVLTKSMAKSLFADESPIGKIVRVDDFMDVRVTGIIEDLPNNSSFDFNFLLPFSYWESQNEWVKGSRGNWENNSFQTFIETAEGVDEEALTLKIKNLIKENKQDSREELMLHPMNKWHLYSDFRNGKASDGLIVYVRMFGLIGLFVLLIACINFTNLSTARSEKRAKEVGIRKTVGSGRSQLIGQFLGEAMMMVTVGFLLSIVIAEMVLPWFNDLTGKVLSVPYGNPVFVALALIFLLITGLLAGSYPAFFLSGFRPMGILKGVSSKVMGGQLARKSLVVSQFTVSVALIIGTLVIWKQIQYVKDRPSGYDANRLMMISSTEDLMNNWNILEKEVRESGAVESMTRASSPVTAINANMKNITWPAMEPNEQILFATVATSWDYTKTLGIKMLEGRDFSVDHPTDSSAVIFNRSAIERMGLENPIGQTVEWDGQPLTIIGVMDDVIMSTPFAPVQPTMVVCIPNWVGQIMVRLSPEIDTKEALAKLEPIFTRHNPDYPFDYQFADEQYSRKFSRVEMVGKIAGAFGGLAIFISCLGLFGLAAYMAERRTKEIGIRKVLGATTANLWSLLSKEYIGLVLIASFVAIPVSIYFVNGWLEKFHYRIDLSWWTFLMAGAVAILITIITVSFQSIKAALANPINSLRSE